MFKSLHKLMRDRLRWAKWSVFFVAMLMPFFEVSARLVSNVHGEQAGDGGDGGDGGGTPNPAADGELTLEQLKEVINHEIKTATKEELAALKSQINNVNRANIFPGIDGNFGDGEAETFGKSIVDTSCFSRVKSVPSTGNFKQDSHVFGMQLVKMGGPFKRLSPEMERFAKMLKCRGKYSKMASSGINVEENNEVNFSALKQILGLDYKAAGLSEGVVADGGALVPVEYPAVVIEFAFTQSPILSRVWRMPMGTNVMKIPRLVQAAGSYFGGIQFYSPDEGELKESSKPQFERLSFEAKKRIGLVYLTDELIADSLINIVNYVTGLYVRGFMYDMENMVMNNTPAQAVARPCLGLINDPLVIANGIARTTAGTIKYADLCNLDGQLDENFRDLVWMTRKKTLATLRNERDNNNRPIVQVDYGNFQTQQTRVPSMLGYPCYLTRNMPAIGTQGDIVLGDLGFYMLAMRQDLVIDTSEHVRFIYDEQCIRFVSRYDGMPVVPIAFTELVDSES